MAKINNFVLAIRNNIVHRIGGKKFYEYAAAPGVGWLEYEINKAHENGYLTRTIKRSNGWSVLLIRKK